MQETKLYTPPFEVIRTDANGRESVTWAVWKTCSTTREEVGHGSEEAMAAVYRLMTRRE